MTLVLFVEEPSMGIVLEQLLPRLGLEVALFRIITHQGVSDLERKLPIRLKAWTDPNASFVILRDNDGGDCVKRKSRLLRIGRHAGRGDRTYVRIVCQELEAWFLGDPMAVERAGYRGDLKLKPHQNVDAIAKPSRRLQDRLVESWLAGGDRTELPVQGDDALGDPLSAQRARAADRVPGSRRAEDRQQSDGERDPSIHDRTPELGICR